MWLSPDCRGGGDCELREDLRRDATVVLVTSLQLCLLLRVGQVQQGEAPQASECPINQHGPTAGDTKMGLAQLRFLELGLDGQGECRRKAEQT